MANKIIRDFVYIDINRLYSLYSQIFEGVAEQIVNQFSLENVDSNNVSGPKDNNLTQKVAEASTRTENSILYDHMYNQLETEIGGAIREMKDLNLDNYRDKLAGSFLIKIRGKAELEDYERTREFLGKFNELGETIAYIKATSTPEITEVKENLPALLRQLQGQLKGKSSDDRREINEKIDMLKKLQDPKEFVHSIALDMGLALDPQFVAYLGEWIKTFAPQRYEITVIPEVEERKIAFRGVLDKRFLRLEPDYLRALYGGYVDMEWVMVGKVTYLPGSKNPPMETEPLVTEQASLPDAATDFTDTSDNMEETLKIAEAEATGMINLSDVEVEAESEASMRDPIRGIFNNANVLEKMFFESKVRAEILIQPLAIYQEFTIVDDSEGE